MKHKFLISCLLIFMAMFFCGCSQSQQLHQKLIIQGVGIEKTKKGYQVIVQALDFQNPINQDEPNTKVIETEGETVMEALDNIPKQTSLKAVYSQNLVLALGENAAKIGVNEFIDFFIRHCETRPKVKICISKTVSEILKVKPGDKQLKSKNVHDLVPQELNSDILHFVSNLKNKKASPFAAWIEIENENETKAIHLKGLGLFKEDKLNSLIEGEEAFAFMILKGVPNFGSLVVSSEKTGDVTCRAEKVTQKTETKTHQNQPPEFNINLDINASTFSLDKSFYTHNYDEITAITEVNLSEKIKSICTKLIEKTLKSGIDVFEMSKILKNSDPNYFKKIEKNWGEILPNSKFEVSVKAKLKATGKEPV